MCHLLLTPWFPLNSHTEVRLCLEQSYNLKKKITYRNYIHRLMQYDIIYCVLFYFSNLSHILKQAKTSFTPSLPTVLSLPGRKDI